MKTALVGYTGFVGSNLTKSFGFTDVYNSSNIQEISGREYDLVVSAGNRADSHRINQDPTSDLSEVKTLVEHLSSAKIKKLVLVSTVCVYPAGGAPDEDTALHPESITPYGQNRLFQENALSQTFDTLIVRLPQLYGENLKKGVIYDLANNYRVEHIRPSNEFQHYDVRQLWTDITRALDANLVSLNIATPPLTNSEVALKVFNRDISKQMFTEAESPYSQMYTRNMTTKHAALFAGTGRYLSSKEQSLSALKDFVATTHQFSILDEETK